MRATYHFDYDAETKGLKTELCESPLLTFYDNGMIKAERSHDQGLGGDFWPYCLYRYEPASDSYLLVGMADARDKKFAQTSYERARSQAILIKAGPDPFTIMMEDGHYDNAARQTHPNTMMRGSALILITLRKFKSGIWACRRKTSCG